MKNRKMNSALACLVAVTTMTSMLAAPCVALAADGRTVKEETVYVVTGDNGNANDVIVSDHLINNGDSEILTDRSNLKDIKNVKGDEKFTKKGESLKWSADGDDIYYQGSTDEQTPIQMDISYKMSGEEMSGAEMQGKEGDFVITIRYENNAKANGVTVPFVVMSGLMVKGDNYSHIDVSSGKVIDDGEKVVVAGMAAPGLTDNMSKAVRDAVEDAGLGDEVVISGHTSEFDITDIMTIATCTIPDDMDAGEFAKLDFDDQINQLEKGSTALVDGSEQLYEGLKMLDEKSEEFGDGVDALNSGAGSLKNGVNKLSGGAASLDDGLGSLETGLNTMHDGVKGDGTAKNPGLKGGSSQLSAGAQQVSQGAEQLNESVAALSAGAKAVDDGVAQVAEQIGSLGSGASQAIAGSKAYQDAASSQCIDAAMNLIKEEHEREGSTMSDESYAQIMALLGSEQGAKKQIANSEAVLDQLSQSLGQIDTEKLTQLKQGADALYAGIGSTEDEGSDKQNLVNGVASLKAGAEQVAAGAQSLDGGVDSLLAGFEGKTASGNKSSQDGLLTGTAKLKAGSSLLRSSIGNAGDNDSTTLVGGATQLANGMNTLAEGKNSLLKGITKLVDGSDELSDGMNKLYTDGIKKIVELYNDDLKGSTDRIQSSVDAAKSYNNFSGIDNSMDGSVKFVFKTEVSGN